MISKSSTQHQGLDGPTHVTMHGWYVPDGKTRPGTRCVVEACNREAAYNLCIHHAIPGMVGEVGTRTFVIGTWLVKRRNALRLITLNDYALGELFGGCARFESQLTNQGYRVLGLISSLEELEATKLRHPGLQMTPWFPELPEAEDESPAAL
jgi:hypothetical protein